MRNLIKHGLWVASLATIFACGGSKQAQEPTASNAATTPPSETSESRPATTDTRPVDTSGGSNMGGSPLGGSDSALSQAGQTATAPPPKPVEKLTDAEIVAVTTTANAGEIEMAELAKKKAVSPDVKNYAVMMITQHKDLENKDKQLETKAKIKPAESDTSKSLKSDVDSTISSLKNQKGKEFDKSYMDAQVKAHHDRLDMYDNKLLPNAQNDELKKRLTESRTHVANHLAKAEEIQQKLENPTTGTKPTTPATPAKPAPKK
jgi:putative membrane protein